uniref:Putative homing endonuclease n=1 Tax=Chlamydiales symbiont of Xenoturbella westbladi TaxID=420390 RepID=A5JET3_9BACT|nr:putative homing endonuclease [Chlamydiales symbiont of Xenoturbella westbladi]
MDLEAQWIVGFVDGRGCFHISVNRQKQMTGGYWILPEFTVVQHERDVQVLYALKAYFGCGVVRRNHGNWMAYRVRGIEHLTEMIIPFFEKHKLKTRKGVGFQKFRKILLKMKNGVPLSTEGIKRESVKKFET